MSISLRHYAASVMHLSLFPAATTLSRRFSQARSTARGFVCKDHRLFQLRRPREQPSESVCNFLEQTKTVRFLPAIPEPPMRTACGRKPVQFHAQQQLRYNTTPSLHRWSQAKTAAAQPVQHLAPQPPTKSPAHCSSSSCTPALPRQPCNTLHLALTLRTDSW
jgi:hypothetical protein